MKAEMPNLPVLAKPVSTALAKREYSLKNLEKLSSFLETQKTVEANFPSISVLPDFLNSFLTYLNERERIKISEKQFDIKVSLVREYADKQLTLELHRLNEETNLQLASIQGDVQTRLRQIDRYYDAEIIRIENKYNLKRDIMRTHYEMLERIRRDKKRNMDALIKGAQIQQREAKKATEEIAAVTRHLQRKVLNNTATSDEKQYYLLIMQLRLDSIVAMGEAFCKLASEVD